jgi:hypothetical protein
MVRVEVGVQKRPTITVDEHVYAEMAARETRETEALEWAEATIEDVGDDPEKQKARDLAARAHGWCRGV